MEEVTIGIPKISDEVYMDSSHGTRRPLQLYSVMKTTDDEINKFKIKTIYENLEIQFYEKIIIRLDGEKVYLLNNCMDGSNGFLDLTMPQTRELGMVKTNYQVF